MSRIYFLWLGIVIACIVLAAAESSPRIMLIEYELILLVIAGCMSAYGLATWHQRPLVHFLIGMLLLFVIAVLIVLKALFVPGYSTVLFLPGGGPSPLTPMQKMLEVATKFLPFLLPIALFMLLNSLFLRFSKIAQP